MAAYIPNQRHPGRAAAVLRMREQD